VIAETFPDHLASIQVMRNCGMRFVGEGKPEEGKPTVRYSVARNEFDASRKHT
jgi:RimJ/RimL family protein N-acetyltransferase